MKLQSIFLKTGIGILSLLFLVSFSISCSDDDNNDTLVRFLWNQTGCADPWNTGPGNSNDETSQALVAYLNENGVQNVRVTNFEFDESVAMVCLACPCTIGTIIYVETTENNSSKIEALGFVRVEE